jgi:hypothetical protein
MLDRPRAIILLRSHPGGTKVCVVDPLTNRESDTGLVLRGQALEHHIRRIKETFERSGSRVEVKRAL